MISSFVTAIQRPLYCRVLVGGPTPVSQTLQVRLLLAEALLHRWRLGSRLLGRWNAQRKRTFA